MTKEDQIAYLRRRRKMLRLKQEDVANALGISKSAICHFESYRDVISQANIQKYHEFLEKTFKEM